MPFRGGDGDVFLISLKAGDTGLNLTAADYVFLLDPWWNPAVEAQAIDRSHRIGQTRPVFAYRMIARDTVEEKVLELQNSKRELAEAYGSRGEADRLAGELHARLRYARIDQVFEIGLNKFLGGVRSDIATLSDEISRQFLLD